LRLILADDSILFRSGLDRLLRDADFEVIGLAGDADELRQLVERDQPDVVIVDIRLPPGYSDEGLRAARVIRDRWPEVGVLLLSQYVEPAYAGDVTALGTRSVGYLLKDGVADIGELADAVRRVGSGRSAVDPAVVACLMAARHRDAALEELTRRERAILALMAEGRSNEAICERLHIGPKTVETHVSRIFSKLGLTPTRTEHRRVMAILSYLRARNGGRNQGQP
jgi:DNA-binding NarL/FixJ family response regulator